MKHVSAIIIAILLGVSATVHAAELTGVLVDKACYAKDKASASDDHKGMELACAQACAKNGNTVALVTDKGEVYDVMPMGKLAGEKNAKLVPHMTHRVALTGDVMDVKGTKMIHATDLKMISK
jgi:hypothetical protein